jgi:transcriptional regulator GlxA family with amidase domain
MTGHEIAFGRDQQLLQASAVAGVQYRSQSAIEGLLRHSMRVTRLVDLPAAALLDLDAKADRVQTALTYAKRNLRMPLEIEDLARAACLSPRQFTRVFRTETGTSPAKAVESLRLEAAKLMLEQSRLPVEDIAREAGFRNRERMRRAFVRAYGDASQDKEVG